MQRYEPVDEDRPHNEIERHKQLQLKMFQSSHKQEQVTSHDHRKTLRHVPVPRMRAVESSLAGNDVELEEVEGHEHPVAVVYAIDY